MQHLKIGSHCNSLLQALLEDHLGPKPGREQPAAEKPSAETNGASHASTRSDSEAGSIKANISRIPLTTVSMALMIAGPNLI